MNHQDQPVIAQNRKRGTEYIAVKRGRNPSYSTVTTIAGSTYLVRSESIVPITPIEEEPMPTCSKCQEPPARAIVVYDDEPPPTGEKDTRDVRIVRFCKGHWSEVEALLPSIA